MDSMKLDHVLLQFDRQVLPQVPVLEMRTERIHGTFK